MTDAIDRKENHLGPHNQAGQKGDRLLLSAVVVKHGRSETFSDFVQSRRAVCTASDVEEDFSPELERFGRLRLGNCPFGDEGVESFDRRIALAKLGLKTPDCILK